jgi:hypothetical protein
VLLLLLLLLIEASMPTLHVAHLLLCLTVSSSSRRPAQAAAIALTVSSNSTTTWQLLPALVTTALPLPGVAAAAGSLVGPRAPCYCKSPMPLAPARWHVCCIADRRLARRVSAAPMLLLLPQSRAIPRLLLLHPGCRLFVPAGVILQLRCSWPAPDAEGSTSSCVCYSHCCSSCCGCCCGIRAPLHHLLKVLHVI